MKEHFEIAPEWSIDTIDGSKAPALESLKGKIHLILFFNNGCLACKTRAIPFTLQIAKAFPEIVITGIHTRFEGPEYSDRQIEETKLVHKISYLVYKDKGMTTFEAFKGEGTPHWVLIDEEGKILRSIFGSRQNELQRLYYLLIELLDS